MKPDSNPNDSPTPETSAPDPHPDKQKLVRCFIILRANGWSLGHISYKLNVPKSTLHDWHIKYQSDINTIKFMRMEQIQCANAPTYEEELARLSTYLNRVEAVLSNRSFEDLSTTSLFYFGLHLRSRFHRLRKEAGMPPGLDAAAAESLSYNGCISNRDHVLSAAALAELPPEYSSPVAQSVAAASSARENPIRTNPDDSGGSPDFGSSASSTSDASSGRPSGSPVPDPLSPT